MTDFVERRRYFRVEDKLEFAYKFLHDNEETTDIALVEQQPRSQIFTELETQIQEACQQVSQIAPEVIDLFILLNRKVDLLLGAENGLSLFTDQALRDMPVNLSACGIAFYCQALVPLGRRLLLRIRLKPEDYEISVLAFVISCERVPTKKEFGSDAYLLRADFSGIQDDQQELLIQHVMHCQNRHLRERRQQSS